VLMRGNTLTRKKVENFCLTMRISNAGHVAWLFNFPKNLLQV
jgi:hypothetical protein